MLPITSPISSPNMVPKVGDVAPSITRYRCTCKNEEEIIIVDTLDEPRVPVKQLSEPRITLSAILESLEEDNDDEDPFNITWPFLGTFVTKAVNRNSRPAPKPMNKPLPAILEDNDEESKGVNDEDYEDIQSKEKTKLAK